MSYPSIAFVLPFEGLARTAVAVASELNMNVAAEVGDLQKGVDRARAAVLAGAEVIISRGGTASAIAAALPVPVVEIRVTSSDLVRCFSKLGPFVGKIGLSGFRNIIYGCEELGSLLGYELVQLPIPDESEAREVVARAKREGVRHIIGDHISYLCAQEAGLTAELISSGREGIAQALFEAQHVLKVRREERERGQQIRTILDSVNDGILAVDSAEHVILFNPQAERIFGMEARRVLGRALSEVLPGARLDAVLREGRTEVGEIQQVGSTRLAVKRTPVRVDRQIVGAVLTFSEVTELQRHEQAVRQKLHRKGLVARSKLDQIAGSSAAIRSLVSAAKRYAKTNATVLILGESGTGKEMLAQGIHLESRRQQGPFVAVNCAALPETLLESELFGYEEGAFTGARKGGKQGLFELAHGGTIFLDEIGDMPLSVQSRLLRVLQEKEVMRIGSDGVIPVDVRIVAATNRDLESEVAVGRFRADLFYRLNLLRLEVPPLRRHAEDVPALVQAFSAKLELRHGRRLAVAPDAMALLERHQWPGNVRELENLLERLWLLTDADAVTAEDVRSFVPVGPAPQPVPDPSAAWPDDLTLAELESRAIRRALAAEGGNILKAAQRLGLHRTTLHRKLQKSDA
ncbi:MAG TPA: sigma 54-interacting transcriptional regulator [Symbiobacteriaceae bacterium]|nr:sigma 54-interacting transcriptional regulator [Symbiobacteriaceae bacterium]